MSAYLTVEAVKRGISEDVLLASVINIIIKDRLVAAILDDERG